MILVAMPVMPKITYIRPRISSHAHQGIHSVGSLEVEKEGGNQRNGWGDPAADQGSPMVLLTMYSSSWTNTMDRAISKVNPNKSCKYWVAAVPVKEHHAGLDHLWNFPLVVDEGDADVKLQTLIQGRFPPSCRRALGSIRFINWIPLTNIHFRLTCNFSLAKSVRALSFFSPRNLLSYVTFTHPMQVQFQLYLQDAEKQYTFFASFQYNSA